MAVAADEVCGKLEYMENFENSELSQELEVLKEIYITELSINRDASGYVASVDVQLHPATGENVSKKWVCLTLQLLPPRDYPHSIPEICIRGPRGLADEHIASLKKSLYQMAENRKGEPMMHELIEHVKESLTQLNVPYGQCMICLDDFNGSHKEFTKTDCYHYFHCDCLALYVDHCKLELEAPEASNAFIIKEGNKQIVCPVCREPLPSDLNLAAFLPESGAGLLEERYSPSDKMQELQRKMADLYEMQKQKGGIIDLEEERNKYLLPTDFVYVGSVEESSQDAPLSESVQELSVSKENDSSSDYNKYPQHQRQRDYGRRGGNKGIREHERGGRGARKKREEYVMERAPYSRGEECGSESSDYGRKRGEYARERDEYARERGEYARERGEFARERGEFARERGEYARERGEFAREGEGYRRARQGENRGTWRNFEGSRNRHDRSNKFCDQARPRSTASEAHSTSAGNENASAEKVEQTAETKQRNEIENCRHGIDVTQENQVDGSSEGLRQLQDVEKGEPETTTKKSSRENDRNTFKGKQAPPEKSGNFHRRDRRREHDRRDRRVEEELPERYLQKSQHHERRHQDVHSRISDDGACSKKSPEPPNSSQKIVKEVEIPQKEETANEEMRNDTNVAAPLMSRSHRDKIHGSRKSNETDGSQGKSEPIRPGSNRKPVESGNRRRWQRNRAQDQNPEQYTKDLSRSTSIKKDEMLKEKTQDEMTAISKDRASSGTASTFPEQLKDLVDSHLPGSKVQDENKNNTGIPQGNKTSAPKQSARRDRLHARENTSKEGSTDDHHERYARADGTSQEHLRKDFHSKPKTVSDRETVEQLGDKITNRRNHKNPRRFEADSRPKEGRHFNDRQKFRKDANLETVKARNEISERQCSVDTTDPKPSHSERSNDAHPGFCVRSISTANTELPKTLDT